MLKNLKKISNNEIDENILKSLIYLNDELLTKNKKCKVCNKKYDSNNRYYGDSCVKNLYRNASITNLKDIEDKELYLHSAVLLGLGKIDITKQQMNYVCESYFSKLYFERLNYIDLNILKSKFENRISENKKPIMKLNTAYRITNILKRKKNILQKLKNFDYDKLIDKTILESFKGYFKLLKNVSKTNFEVYYYMQFILWELGAMSNKKSYPFAAKCLSNSLSVIGETPKDIYITNKDKEVVNKIKNDIGLQEKVKKIIKKYSKGDIIVFDESVVKNSDELLYTFTEGDLFYSLHTITLTFYGRKDKKKWNLKVKISDKYDFNEILSNNILTRKSKKYITKGNILNDMAAVSSQYGVIKEYNITITFDWSDFDA